MLHFITQVVFSVVKRFSVKYHIKANTNKIKVNILADHKRTLGNTAVKLSKLRRIQANTCGCVGKYA